MRRALRRSVIYALGLVLCVLALGTWRYLALPADIPGSAAVEFHKHDVTQARSARAERRLPSPTWGGNVARTRSLDFRLRPPYLVKWTMHARSLIELPPAAAYGRLYFGTHGGFFYAVDGKSGQVVWQLYVGRCIASSPTVAAGVVYVGVMGSAPCRKPHGDEGAVIALDAESGHELWRYECGLVESSPLLVGHLLYFAAYRQEGRRGSFYAVDVRNHRRAWRYGGVGKVAGAAAYRNGLVYFASYNRHLYALKARSGDLAWESQALPSLLPHFGRYGFYATPAIAYGRVFIGGIDGRMYSFGAASGQLLWASSLKESGVYNHLLTTTSVFGNIYSSAAVSRQRVFVGSNNHNFYAFDAASGRQLWSYRAQGKIVGSPTVMAGLVYFSTVNGHTYALSIYSGAEIWSFGDGGYSPLLASTQRAYLVGQGRVYGLVEGSPEAHLLRAEGLRVDQP